MRYDLAVLVLSDVIPSSEAKPIAPRFDPPLLNAERYSALGFGATCAIASQEKCYLESGTRRRVDGLAVTCAEACPDWTYAASEWLGGGDLCEGDSGGPAIDSEARVMGIGSRGSTDSQGNCIDAVYVRVGAWRAFLIASARKAAMGAGIDAPEWADRGGSGSGAKAERTRAERRGGGRQLGPGDAELEPEACGAESAPCASPVATETVGGGCGIHPQPSTGVYWLFVVGWMITRISSTGRGSKTNGGRSAGPPLTYRRAPAVELS